MTDERRAPTGFTQGLLSRSVLQTEQLIEEWFEEVDLGSYGKAYEDLALSGARGALEALRRQQSGASASSDDPVDPVRFFADPWLSGLPNAWAASLDLSRKVASDLSRSPATDPPPTPKRPPAKKTAKKATRKQTAKKAAPSKRR